MIRVVHLFLVTPDIPCLIFIIRTQLYIDHSKLIVQFIFWLVCILLQLYIQRSDKTPLQRSCYILITLIGKILNIWFCYSPETSAFHMALVIQYQRISCNQQELSAYLCLLIGTLSLVTPTFDVWIILPISGLLVSFGLSFINTKEEVLKSDYEEQVILTAQSEQLLDKMYTKFNKFSNWLRNERVIILSEGDTSPIIEHISFNLNDISKNQLEPNKIISSLMASKLQICNRESQISKMFDIGIISIRDAIKLLYDHQEFLIIGTLVETQLLLSDKILNIFTFDGVKKYTVLHFIDVTPKADNMLIDVCKSISHEFGTNLNCISSLAEVANQSDYIPELIKNQYIRPILINSSELQLIIGNIRDYGSIQTKQFQSKLSLFEVKYEIQSLIRYFEESCRSRSINIEIVQHVLQTEIINNRNAFRQIFYQLFHNAVRYTQSGFIKVEIDNNKGGLEIKVINSNSPMNKEEQEKLEYLLSKDKLIRVSTYSVGSGLGLMIANKLIKEINRNCEDRIQFLVKDNTTEFSFEMKNHQISVAKLIQDESSPVQKLSIYRIVDQNQYIDKFDRPSIILHNEKQWNENYHPSPKSLKIVQYNHNKLPQKQNKLKLRRLDSSIEKILLDQKCCTKVLIVDDEYFNILAIKAILQSRFGLAADSAYNGSEAIKCINDKLSKPCYDCENKYYSLIFLDLNMPIMDGFQAVMIIKQMIQQEDISKCYCIASTAFTDMETKIQAYDAGMDYFMTKPLDISKLNTIISKLYPN